MKCLCISILLGCSVVYGAGQPCDPQASAPARALFNTMLSLQGKGIMFGQQDTLAYGIGWKGEPFNSDVNRVCGHFPAICGWDLSHIGEPNNIDGVPFARMHQWMEMVHTRGGINTISWHIRVPGTNQDAWTHDRVVEHILPGGDRHEIFKKKLDLVAVFLGSLKDQQGHPIPVIFRPFHENMGSWFWWGKDFCTAKQYRALFRFTVDYLRKTKGLHSLLICYSPNTFPSRAAYLSRYPGDDYVDILGVDHYFTVKDTGINTQLQTIATILVGLAHGKGKLAALSETGLQTLPNPTWWTGFLLPNLKASKATRQLSYVLVWRNGRPDHFYAPYPGQASAEDFKAFAADPLILFMDDLKD